MNNSAKNVHFGYKKCKNNRIVKLEIIGIHNENRKNIIDKTFAMMRCSKARVISIRNMYNKSIKYKTAVSFYDDCFVYNVGKIVLPKLKFDSNLEEVHSSGIHYFLTYKAAFFSSNYWNYISPWCEYYRTRETGFYETWYDNGQIKSRYIFKDGLEHGLCELW